MNLVLFLVFIIVFSPRRSFHITPRITCSASMLVITIALIFLLLCDDIEPNAGLRQNTAKTFSICHWNLNPLMPGGSKKVTLN